MSFPADFLETKELTNTRRPARQHTATPHQESTAITSRMHCAYKRVLPIFRFVQTTNGIIGESLMLAGAQQMS